MGRGDTVRAFLALDIPDSLRDELLVLRDVLRPLVHGARFVDPRSIHLTLRFLGDTSPGQIERVAERVAPAAAACPAADVPPTPLGVFPERGNPRILWLGLAPGASMMALQEACEAAAVAAGFPREGRAFRPHLTLARWRDRAPRPDLPPVALRPARLARLVLYRSDLAPSGATYTALRTFPLAPAT